MFVHHEVITRMRIQPKDSIHPHRQERVDRRKRQPPQRWSIAEHKHWLAPVTSRKAGQTDATDPWRGSTASEHSPRPIPVAGFTARGPPWPPPTPPPPASPSPSFTPH